MLDGCRGKREPEPVPGPQSASAHETAARAPQTGSARGCETRWLLRL